MHFTEEIIIELCKVDAELITLAFKISEKLGIEATKNSISNFSTIIKNAKGNVVLQLDFDYRTYIVNLLKLVNEKISEENKSVFLKTVMGG